MYKIKRAYVSQWKCFNIDFQNFPKSIKFSTENLPGSDFYNYFYKIFFKKYKCFHDLPTIWLKTKEGLADEVLKTAYGINGNPSILSYGCGIGYMESYLGKKDNTDIYAFDFASETAKWMLEDKKVKFIKNQEAVFQKKYDLIYFCQLLYCCTEEECKDLMSKAYTSLNDGGKLIIIHHSSYSIENMNIFRAFLSSAKKLQKSLRSKIRNIVPKRYLKIKKPRIQFWGWQRSCCYYKNLGEMIGYGILSARKVENQSFITLIKE